VTLILWMGDVEEEKPMMREFRGRENLRNSPLRIS